MDIQSLYYNVEAQQPGTRVKRRLRIISNERQTVSPNKALPSIAEAKEEKAFGRPRKICDSIVHIMQYNHLNEFLR
jgi:hypothetical protein